MRGNALQPCNKVSRTQKEAMTGAKGNSGRVLFPEAKPRETMRSRGNKTHCFLQGQSLSVLFPSTSQLKTRKEKRKEKSSKKSFALRLLAASPKVHVVAFLGGLLALFLRKGITILIV